MKEQRHQQSKERYKTQGIKVSRRHHQSRNIQNKIRHTKVIHVTLRPRTKSIPSSQYNSNSIPNSLTKCHHQNVSNKATQTKNVTHSTNVPTKNSCHNSSSHSNQNSWHNDDFEEKLMKRNDKVYKNAKHDSKLFSTVTVHPTESNSAMFKNVNMKNGCPDWTTFENEHQRRDNKKKKTKCSRACIITSIVVALLLVIVITIILIVLLDKSNATTLTISKTAVLRWNSTGITVAGVTNQLGTASNKLNLPLGLALDYLNSLYISDFGNNRVQKYLINASFGITVAGQANGTGCSLSICLLEPAAVAVDTNGNVYVADTVNNRVQFWSAGSLSGITVAGNNSAANSSDQLDQPYGISRDPNSGALYISDTLNNRVMRYLPGTLPGTLFAGTGVAGPSNTQLVTPYGIYFDLPTNSLLIANTGMHSVVRWTVGASNWTFVVGSNNGLPGSSSTEFNTPVDVTLDPMGNIYVADTYNYRIQFFPAGQLNGTTIAGINNTQGANASLLNKPFYIALDSQLNLYVSDTFNYRVQKFLRY